MDGDHDFYCIAPDDEEDVKKKKKKKKKKEQKKSLQTLNVLCVCIFTDCSKRMIIMAYEEKNLNIVITSF